MTNKIRKISMPSIADFTPPAAPALAQDPRSIKSILTEALRMSRADSARKAHFDQVRRDITLAAGEVPA